LKLPAFPVGSVVFQAREYSGFWLNDCELLAQIQTKFLATVCRCETQYERTVAQLLREDQQQSFLGLE